jgi:hypothetical protein
MASIIKADTLQSTTSNVFVLNSAGTEYARFDSSGVFQLANPTTFPAGTAALPSITATGDTNTGIFFPAADTIAFAEGGVESMRIDSSGNVKLSAANTKILNSSGNPILQQTGSVLQVVSVEKADTFSTTSSSFVDVTGLTVSITPSSSSSKILVLFQANGSQNVGAGRASLRLLRDSTIINAGTAVGSRISALGGFSSADNSIPSAPVSGNYLDSPATTSSTTYKIQLAMTAGAGSAYINQTQQDTDQSSQIRMASQITVMEIAA